MKETPIIMRGDHPHQILEGTKIQTRRVITPYNSLIGEGGDWSKLDFEGKTIFKDSPSSFDLKWLAIHRRAPLPFVDGKPAIGQYLHVPYDWEEDMRVFRVYSRWEVGMRLWVKETYTMDWWQAASLIVYKADVRDPNAVYDPIMRETSKPHWTPSIFMPHWASRITLEITTIRVERLNCMTENDAHAEGADSLVTFMQLWDRLNKKRGYSWDKNSWVWVISFINLEVGK